jgi:hypothetical protein
MTSIFCIKTMLPETAEYMPLFIPPPLSNVYALILPKNPGLVLLHPGF